MDESITKRIHISGLTQAITAKDLSDRLASFGTVKAIDGFGALDALGQPRKFAYATLETTKGKLTRCTFCSAYTSIHLLRRGRHESPKRCHMEGCQIAFGGGKA